MSAVAPLHPNARARAADASASEAPADAQADGGFSEHLVVPLVEERVRVSKIRREAGRVRVRTFVRQRDETIDVSLAEERVHVERVAIGRPAERVEAPRYEGDTYIIPVYEEVFVVEKRLVLREEIHVRTERTETRTPQTVTLRSTDFVVERDGPSAPSVPPSASPRAAPDPAPTD